MLPTPPDELKQLYTRWDRASKHRSGKGIEIYHWVGQLSREKTGVHYSGNLRKNHHVSLYRNDYLACSVVISQTDKKHAYQAQAKSILLPLSLFADGSCTCWIINTRCLMSKL